MRPEDIIIGDRLRVREWEDMAEEFGYEGDEIACDLTFTQDMEYMCGMPFTVEAISSDMRRFFSKEGIEEHWSISADMLEPLEADQSESDEDFQTRFSMLCGQNS